MDQSMDLLQNRIIFAVADIVVIFEVAHHFDEHRVVDFVITLEGKSETAVGAELQKVFIRAHDNCRRILLADFVEFIRA